MAGKGRPFQKGEGGRKPGSPNKKTIAFKEFWGEWLESEEYRRKLQERINRSKAPHMETYFAHQIWGKVPDTVNVTGALDLAVRLQQGRQRVADERD